VFAFCVGRTFRVSEIDRAGLLVLDVSAEVDRRFGGYGNAHLAARRFAQPF